jgi:hypothetical protein
MPGGAATACVRWSTRRLKEEDQSAVLACLHEEHFQDCSPGFMLRCLTKASIIARSAPCV